MKTFLLLLSLSIFLIACCPKRDCPSFSMTDAEWDMLGTDTTNILPSLMKESKKLKHNCIFKDEKGKYDTLIQTLESSYGQRFCEWFCCNSRCGNWIMANQLKDSLDIHLLFWQIQFGSDFHFDLYMDRQTYNIQEFTDTLSNFPFQDTIYPQAFLYQPDSAQFLPDSVYLKRLYFAPKKGILKIEISPNHIWERTN